MTQREPHRSPPAHPSGRRFKTSRSCAARHLWTVVLAAGGSRRLGVPKQLLKLGRRSLLHRVAARATALTPARVVIVVGAEHLRVRRHLRRTGLTVTTCHNGRWQEGMAASLARGVRALPPSASAALVLVTDQPLVGTADIARLIRLWSARPARPAAAAYAKRLGVPAIVPRRHFAALMNGTGDQGARRLLRTLPGVVALPLPAAAFDIDTPADADRLGVVQRVAQLIQPLAPER